MKRCYSDDGGSDAGGRRASRLDHPRRDADSTSVESGTWAAADAAATTGGVRRLATDRTGRTASSDRHRAPCRSRPTLTDRQVGGRPRCKLQRHRVDLHPPPSSTWRRR